MFKQRFEHGTFILSIKRTALWRMRLAWLFMPAEMRTRLAEAS